MYLYALTISGSQLGGLVEAIGGGLSKKDRSDHDLGQASVFVLESAYKSKIGAGTLSSTIIVDQRKTEQTAVSIITAGGGGGLLHLRAGEAEKQTEKIVAVLEDICAAHQWELKAEGQ